MSPSIATGHDHAADWISESTETETQNRRIMIDADADSDRIM